MSPLAQVHHRQAAEVRRAQLIDEVPARRLLHDVGEARRRLLARVPTSTTERALVERLLDPPRMPWAS